MLPALLPGVCAYLSARNILTVGTVHRYLHAIIHPPVLAPPSTMSTSRACWQHCPPLTLQVVDSAVHVLEDATFGPSDAGYERGPPPKTVLWTVHGMGGGAALELGHVLYTLRHVPTLRVYVALSITVSTPSWDVRTAGVTEVIQAACAASTQLRELELSAYSNARSLAFIPPCVPHMYRLRHLRSLDLSGIVQAQETDVMGLLLALAQTSQLVRLVVTAAVLHALTAPGVTPSTAGRYPCVATLEVVGYETDAEPTARQVTLHFPALRFLRLSRRTAMSVFTADNDAGEWTDLEYLRYNLAQSRLDEQPFTPPRLTSLRELCVDVSDTTSTIPRDEKQTHLDRLRARLRTEMTMLLLSVPQLEQLTVVGSESMLRAEFYVSIDTLDLLSRLTYLHLDRCMDYSHRPDHRNDGFLRHLLGPQSPLAWRGQLTHLILSLTHPVLMHRACTLFDRAAFPALRGCCIQGMQPWSWAAGTEPADLAKRGRREAIVNAAIPRTENTMKEMNAVMRAKIGEDLWMDLHQIVAVTHSNEWQKAERLHPTSVDALSDWYTTL
jgi:hypothetical protein